MLTVGRFKPLQTQPFYKGLRNKLSSTQQNLLVQEENLKFEEIEAEKEVMPTLNQFMETEKELIVKEEKQPIEV